MAKLAFDTGGTFTDFALIDDHGVVHLHKVLSTPANPADAVITGAGELLARVNGDASPENLQVLGATTVVTNAVLERKGVKTAFIATDGFQDMLRIRNEGRYDLYDLKLQYPEPLVPRNLCLGIGERVTAEGDVVTALDEAGVAGVAARLKHEGIRSVAVCLLHAYKHPGHEKRIGALLTDADPDLFVSLSSEVCPEVREFDRASTTVVNAYTRPLMAGYVRHLEKQLGGCGVSGQFLWMTSSGGMVPSARAAEAPVRLIESGPAAGAVAAAEYARLAGETSVLSFDMGGTTAKLCLIPNGEPKIGTDLEVARHQRFAKGSGFPLKIQSIQMIEIGAGGGSIAARNPLGLLDVGPRSAGAEPGPAAYGRGGTEPTVTDADILLGYVGVNSFVGGSFKVSREPAEAAMERLAEMLGITAERCAYGIHDVINESMAKAASMHAADCGVDPRTLPMVAFGGAGPVHAYGVARKLGVRKVICPVGAGVTSAVGLLIAPVAVDVSASAPMAVARWDRAAMTSVLASLAEQGRAIVLGAGISPEAVALAYSVDMRHVGQGHEITVAVPSLDLPEEAFMAELLENFFRRYRDLYGRNVHGSDVEAITWRLRTSGPKGRVSRPKVERKSTGEGALKGHRPVYFEELRQRVETPVYDHYALETGVEIKGPAIVEQAESTVVVGPRATAHVDAQSNLVMLIS
jgi:N-methylhydantoinase A